MAWIRTPLRLVADGRLLAECRLQVQAFLSASSVVATPSFHGFAFTCLVPSVYHQALLTELLPLPVLAVIATVSKVL